MHPLQRTGTLIQFNNVYLTEQSALCKTVFRKQRLTTCIVAYTTVRSLLLRFLCLRSVSAHRAGVYVPRKFIMFGCCVST